MERRRFLQLGFGGSAVLALGGFSLFMRSSRLRETPTLQVFSAAEYAVLAAIANRVCPGSGNLPSAEEIGVAEKVDGLFARMHPRDAQDFKLALGLFENALAGLLHDQRVTPFTRLDGPDQDAVLRNWKESRVGTARMIYRSIRDLVASTYWGDPRTFAAANYPGPPALGG